MRTVKRPLTADEQLTNLMKLLGFTTYVELAAWMGQADDSNLHNWRRRGRGMIPQEVVITIAEKYGLSTDWLIFGEGPAWRKEVLEKAVAATDEEAAVLARLKAMPTASALALVSQIAGLNGDAIEIVKQVVERMK